MYKLDILVQGYPGKTICHGGLGWSTIALVRGHGETAMIDTGFFNTRDIITERLGAFGLRREDVTSVLITHCHWDHMVNFPIFPNARFFAPRRDVDWALSQPVPTWHIPEFYVEKLASDRRTVFIEDGDEFLPGIRAVATPGHTPGHLTYVTKGETGQLIFAGDAAKNQAELSSINADLTLNIEESKASIRRIRGLAQADPNDIVICGHDRLLSLVEDKVVYRAELVAAIKARLSTDFDSETTIDLVVDPKSHD